MFFLAVRQRNIEELIEKLPGKDCGACGCPDCQTFAEDVADNKAVIEDCVLLGRYPAFKQTGERHERTKEIDGSC